MLKTLCGWKYIYREKNYDLKFVYLCNIFLISQYKLSFPLNFCWIETLLHVTKMFCSLNVFCLHVDDARLLFLHGVVVCVALHLVVAETRKQKRCLIHWLPCLYEGWSSSFCLGAPSFRLLAPLLVGSSHVFELK